MIKEQIRYISPSGKEIETKEVVKDLEICSMIASLNNKSYMKLIFSSVPLYCTLSCSFFKLSSQIQKTAW